MGVLETLAILGLVLKSVGLGFALGRASARTR
jgi:hypothetical protein